MSNAIKNVSTAIGIKFSAHDLRRTAATIAAEHGYSSDQISRLLNQKQKNVTQEYVQKTLAMLKAPLLIFVREKEKALGEYWLRGLKSMGKLRTPGGILFSALNFR